jgi:hypothetical protein
MLFEVQGPNFIHADNTNTIAMREWWIEGRVHRWAYFHFQFGGVPIRLILSSQERRKPFCSRPSFLPHYGPGVDSASNRNEYQEFSLGRPAHKADNLTAICKQIV